MKPKTLSPKIYEGIGKVAVHWTGLDHCLTLSIGKLAGFDDVFDPTPFVLVNHSSFPQRLDMFSTLCEMLKKNHKNLTGFKEVIAELKAAQKERNMYLHSPLMIGDDDETFRVGIGSARGKLKAKVENRTLEDLNNAVAKIDKATERLTLMINTPSKENG